MTRSVIIQGIGLMMATSCPLEQCAGTVGSQLWLTGMLTGMQFRPSTRKVPIHHRMTTPIRTRARSRNAGVMKMR